MYLSNDGHNATVEYNWEEKKIEFGYIYHFDLSPSRIDPVK